jgi:hypothetical protein
MSIGLILLLLALLFVILEATGKLPGWPATLVIIIYLVVVAGGFAAR